MAQAPGRRHTASGVVHDLGDGLFQRLTWQIGGIQPRLGTRPQEAHPQQVNGSSGGQAVAQRVGRQTSLEHGATLCVRHAG